MIAWYGIELEPQHREAYFMDSRSSGLPDEIRRRQGRRICDADQGAHDEKRLLRRLSVVCRDYVSRGLNLNHRLDHGIGSVYVCRPPRLAVQGVFLLARPPQNLDLPANPIMCGVSVLRRIIEKGRRRFWSRKPAGDFNSFILKPPRQFLV